MRTLSELGVDMDRIIFALNKSDLLTISEIEEKMSVLNLKDYKKQISISAKTGYNINELKSLIKNIIQNQKSPVFKKETQEGFDNIYGN